MLDDPFLTLLKSGPEAAAPAHAILLGLFAGTMLVAGIAKLRSLPAFGQAVQRYGLMPLVLVGPTARLVATLETSVGVGLIAAPAMVSTLLSLTIGLLAIFTAAIGVNLLRGRSFDCGCGVTDSPIAWPHIARNFVLASIAAWALMTMPLEAESWMATPIVSASAILTAGVLAYRRTWNDLPAKPREQLNHLAALLAAEAGNQHEASPSGPFPIAHPPTNAQAQLGGHP